MDGDGNDVLNGGAGDDTCVFNVGDTSAGLEFAEFVNDTEGVNHLRLGGALSIDAMALPPIDGFGLDAYLLDTGRGSLLVRGLQEGAIGTVEVAGTSYRPGGANATCAATAGCSQNGR